MNYDQILDAVHRYVHRTEPETVGNEATALEFALARINRDFAVREAIKGIDLALVAGEAALPDDFASADALIGPDGVEHEYLAPRQYYQQAAGDVRPIFTIEGSVIAVHPGQVAARLIYFARAPSITNGETNFLSQYYPDLWTYLAAAEQFRFIQNPDAQELAERHARGLVSAAIDASTRNRQAGGAIRMRGR